MRPVWKVVVDGRQNATAAIRDRFLSLRVTDEAGRESDSCELRLDDRGGAIEQPRRGATLEVSLGYEDRDVTVVGAYVVDEIAFAGPPQTLVVRAKAADMQGGLKAQQTRSWEDVTLGALVGRLAADHGLEARVGSSLRTVRIPHLDQTEESDLHLLTRLAGDYDAVAKPTGGHLLFVPRWQSASATGKPMPSVAVRPVDTSSWSVTIADRPKYGSVRAHWHDAASGERKAETAGSDDPAFTLWRSYATAAEARHAARSMLARLAAGTRRLILDLAPGQPAVAAEEELRLAGFRDGVDGSWTCQRAVHTLDSRGYRTRAEGVVGPTRERASQPLRRPSTAP